MLYLCVADPDAHESIRNRLGSEDPNIEHPFVDLKAKKNYFLVICSSYVYLSDPDAHGSIRKRLGTEDPNLEHPFVNPKSVKIY